MKILFLCSGNYYRSRVAEAIFNHLAINRGVDVRAISRGFKAKPKEMGLAPEAEDFLNQRNIAQKYTHPFPQQLEKEDLMDASLVVAVCESEHRPKLEKQFPSWEERVIFWQIQDVDFIPAELAMPDLESCVIELFNTNS